MSIRNNKDFFDVFFKDYFNTAESYLPLSSAKTNYPVDIFQKGESLFFNVACVGLTKADLKLETNGDILRVSYDKPKGEDSSDIFYAQKNITRRSFDFGWRVNSKFDLTKALARMNNGLLEVEVPMKEESKPKQLQIN